MNHQGQGDSTKTCINETVDKICDIFKCTAKRVFPTKNSPCNKSDKPWFNKSCLQKRKKFHTAKYSYSFVKNKEICEFKKVADFVNNFIDTSFSTIALTLVVHVRQQ
jgi:hypothetical protein